MLIMLLSTYCNFLKKKDIIILLRNKKKLFDFYQVEKQFIVHQFKTYP